MKKDTLAFSGFEPANTTPVPDVLFDELLPFLTEAELKVLLYIIRRTWGFKKVTDAISLNQFQKGITTRDDKVLDRGCGIKDRKTIVRALASLEKKGCICGTKSNDPHGDKATTLYHIHFKEVVGISNHPYIGSGNFQPPVVGISNHGSGQNQPRVVGNSNPQETVLQDTVKQQTDSQKREYVSANASTSHAPTSYQNLPIPVTYAEALAYLVPHGPHEGLDAVQVVKLAQKLWTEAHEKEDTPLVAGRQFKQVVKGATDARDTHADLAVRPGDDSSRHSSDSLRAVPDMAREKDAVERTQEKPKRGRKKPQEVQLTLHEQEIKAWYEELRGVEVSFSKRNVAALQALGKRTMSKDDFLNVTAILDGDKWFEEHKIGVDLYWIDRQWDNKIIYLQRKKPALDDKKPLDIYTAASMDKERNQRNYEKLVAKRLAREAEAQQGVNHGTN